MKKKFGLLGLALVSAVSLAGCGSKSDSESVYDQAMMEQYADAIVSSFSNMSEESFEQFTEMSDLELDLTLLQSGLPIEAENFKTMIEAWESGAEECGAIYNLGEPEMAVKNDSATLIVPFEGENRDGDLEFVFDEKMNIESITVSGHYDISEILKKAGLNTLLGMGTVFVVLIFISFIISLFGFIPAIQKKFSKKSKEESKPAAPVAAVETPVAVKIDDSELIAVIAAAIAAAEGTSTDGFVVRSIKRRKSNKWN